MNIVIGANGTGKTHLLKLLYAACAVTYGEDREKSYPVKLRNVFSPYQGRMGRLARRETKSVKAQIAITRLGGERLTADFSNHTKRPEDVTLSGEAAWKKERLQSVYIPVKEMLAHAPGFLAIAAAREIAFEEVYVDIIKRAFLPKLSGPTEKRRKQLLALLQKAIEGKVSAEGEHLFLKNEQGDLEFTLLAEGIRKLALIWLLIQNGTLLAGAVLFWDEPEANMNPALMGEVVEIILELQRMGVQVFLTTHNYVLLKEFDLRREQNDKIQFISLFREAGDVKATTSEALSSVTPNALTSTFDNLYDREITRSLNGLKL